MLGSTTDNNTEKQKNITLHWIITVLLGITLAAYGYIFTSVIGRVAKAENNIDNLNPILLQIQTDLAGIKSDISWIRQAQQKDNIK